MKENLEVKIKRLIKEKKTTQEKLAEYLDVSKSTISRCLSSEKDQKRKLTCSRYKSIADFLGISFKALIENTNKEFDKKFVKYNQFLQDKDSYALVLAQSLESSEIKKEIEKYEIEQFRSHKFFDDDLPDNVDEESLETQEGNENAQLKQLSFLAAGVSIGGALGLVAINGLKALKEKREK